MTTKTNIYVRHFSEISQLQTKELVYYNLCSTEEKDYVVYGLEITSEIGKKLTNKSALNKISCSKKLVLDILNYLYENSVRPDSAIYVVEDILNLKKISDKNVLLIS